MISKYLKKILVLLLVLVLFVCTSCSNQNKINVNNGNQIIDASNRVINIPINNKEATIASVYAVAVPFIKALKITDRIKAINTKTTFWKDTDEYINNAKSVGRGVVDYEKLASINPTCLIHRMNDNKTIEAVEKLGIDCICIKVENIDDIKYTLNILGKYFGVEENAENVINWIDNKFKYIDDITSIINDSNKKTAIVMGGTLGRVAGEDMLQSWMINKAGGASLIKEKKDSSWVDISVEKIFEYDPEYIFISQSGALDYSIDDILNDKSWSSLKAVKNKNIFYIPASYDPWDLPGISPVIGTMYMTYKMYPNILSKNELEKQIDEYYMMMFGKTFDKQFLKYNLD